MPEEELQCQESGWTVQQVRVEWETDAIVVLEGISNNKRLAAPLAKVSPDMKTLKFPILSARKPASGGPIISAPGITPFT